MNKLDYTCSIADPERGHNMLFEFWDFETKPIISSLHTHHESMYAPNDLGDYYDYCRPSTRIQEFISVDVMPSGFVWEVDYIEDSPCDRYILWDEKQTKSQIDEMGAAYIKCIGLASNYAHYADELNMKVIEGVRCDYSD